MVITVAAMTLPFQYLSIVKPGQIHQPAPRIARVKVTFQE